MKIIVEKWPKDKIQKFEERAAIKEYDGNMDREKAELQAFDEMKNQLILKGIK